MPLIDLILLVGTKVNIQLNTPTQDASGGQVDAWSTLTIPVNGQALTAIPCMIRPASARLVTEYAQRGITISNSILFYFNVDAAVGGIGIGTMHRCVDPATGYIYRIEGSGIYDPLIVSGEQVWRLDAALKRSPS
jgi:hypothetical protein